jgi:hypothetical protein
MTWFVSVLRSSALNSSAGEHGGTRDRIIDPAGARRDIHHGVMRQRGGLVHPVGDLLEHAGIPITATACWCSGLISPSWEVVRQFKVMHYLVGDDLDCSGRRARPGKHPARQPRPTDLGSTAQEVPVPKNAALVTALLIERPTCIRCILVRAGMTPLDFDATLEVIETVLVLRRRTDRCWLCERTETVLSVDRPVAQPDLQPPPGAA